MGSSLVMFVGSSSISIVEQYRLQLQTENPVTFLLPHKNEVVLKKLFHVIQAEFHGDVEKLSYNGELGSCYFIVDEQEPFIKIKREDNEALVRANQSVFVDFAKQYDHVLLIGESSCSFDAVVIEFMLEQLYALKKSAHVISWCPIQSDLARENNTALLQAIKKYGVQHTVVTAQDEEPDGFLSLFKAYNREIALVVDRVFQGQQ
ncbi:MAG: hypothetical protein ABS882_00180 [Lysinibacillus sp.]